ncbi:MULTISPECIES: hypothetical protein [unclassified Streptomyces]|uniref:hypothetical protein n=1 Tax=unclassified Streptomyces TaxID=2593676 RepID=UPI00403CB03E
MPDRAVLCRAVPCRTAPGLRAAGCGLRAAGCGLRAAGCGLQGGSPPAEEILTRPELGAAA